MSEGTTYYVWPVANERTLTLALLLLVGLFVGAVLLELYRRRRDRALRLRAEWRGVSDICEDRELLKDDRNLLHAILRQYAAEKPYAAVTKRSLFDSCIAHYFMALSSTESNEVIESRGIRLREIRNQLGLDFVPLGRRIHMTRSLRAGQLMQVAAASGTPNTWYPFAMSDLNEATMSIRLVNQSDTPEFPPGTRLKFRLWREEDARYLFETTVSRVDVKNKRWVLRHADSITRSQSRAYFRLRVEQSVQVSVLNATLNDDYDGIYEREPVTQIRGRLSSLSGGGLAVVFPQPVPKQVLLRMLVSIPTAGGIIPVIVHPIASQTLSGGRCLIRGMFVAMEADTRECITRYIFSKQKHLAESDSADR